MQYDLGSIVTLPQDIQCEILKYVDTASLKLLRSVGHLDQAVNSVLYETVCVVVAKPESPQHLDAAVWKSRSRIQVPVSEIGDVVEFAEYIERVDVVVCDSRFGSSLFVDSSSCADKGFARFSQLVRDKRTTLVIDGAMVLRSAAVSLLAQFRVAELRIEFAQFFENESEFHESLVSGTDKVHTKETDFVGTSVLSQLEQLTLTNVRPAQRMQQLAMVHLVSLKLERCAISTIDLQFAPNLRSLNLCGNNVKQIRNLQRLSNLHYLNLTHNGIHNIGHLDFCIYSTCQHVDLSGNPVSLDNIAQHFPWVEHLVTRSIQLDCAVLSLELPKLRKLNLSRNRLPKRFCLAKDHIRSLQDLDLSHNLDLSQLVDFDFKNLQRLNISYTNIAKLDFLRSTSLTVLDIRETKVRRDMDNTKVIPALKSVKTLLLDHRFFNIN